MKNEKTDILGVGFDDLTPGEAVERGLALLGERRGAYVVTPNPEIVMACRQDGALRRAVAAADLVLADGIGVIYGARILGRRLSGRVPGIDFAAALMGRLAERGGSVFLFGARPGVAEAAGESLLARFPGLVLAGCENGYFTQDAPILAHIRETAPDFLLVCLGSPKQELWMEKNAGALPVGLMAGLGGSLDVFAGIVKRAPALWRRLGLEWLYRLLSDPRRLGRMMKLPRFLFAAVGQRLSGGGA